LPLEAATLACVEAFEHGVPALVRDPIGHAATARRGVGNEGDDATGRVERASLIGRPLPEAPDVARELRRGAFDVVEGRTPHERSVAEDPTL
jgi:hypothetical protein